MHLMKTWARMPAAMPLAMEPVKMTKRIITKGPNASEKLEKSILPMSAIIKKPTKMRAGPVAASGIIKNRGAAKTERRKRAAVVTAVRPVRPPASTPEEDST